MSNVPLNVAPNVVPNIAPNTAPNIAPNVAPSFAPNIVPNLAPNVAPNVALNVAPSFAQNVTPNVAPKVAPKVAAAGNSPLFSSSNVQLSRDGQCVPWGIKLVGGSDTGSHQFIVAKVSFSLVTSLLDSLSFTSVARICDIYSSRHVRVFILLTLFAFLSFSPSLCPFKLYQQHSISLPKKFVSLIKWFQVSWFCNRFFSHNKKIVLMHFSFLFRFL